jgi:pimeloyl-ACP methyl ester carboxylesterase
MLSFVRRAAMCAAILLLATLASAAPPPVQPHGVDVSGLEHFECPKLFGALLDSLAFPQSSDAVCGHIARTEREDGTGRPIKLAVAIVPPIEPPADVPIVYLHGGPGGDVLRYVEDFGDYPLAKSRTLILFDQRGWGSTTPHLCETLGAVYDELAGADLPKEESQERELKAYQDCLAELQAQEADLAAYSTEATVRDLEAIRKTLGIDTWHVYGASYGTTVALAYMAAHPQPIRSVILDATSPPEQDNYPGIVADFARADARVLALCTADPKCARRFPNLDNALTDAITTLEREPVEITVSALLTAKTLKMTGGTFLAGLHLLHYDTYSVGMIPLLLDAARQRRVDELSIIAMMNSASSAVIGAGANLAIRCRETHGTNTVVRDDPIIPPSVLIDAFGFKVNEEFCKTWPSRTETAAVTPTNVAMPTLVLAGHLDPITPPENGKYVAEKLGAKAQFVEFPYLSHGSVDIHPCADEIALAFLANPDAAVDSSCITDMQPPLFETEVVSIWGSWQLSQGPGLLVNMRALMITLVAIIGLMLTTLIWPAIWLVRVLIDRRKNKDTSVMQKSAVAVGLSIGFILLWLGVILWAVVQTAETQPTALVIGLPGRVWPGTWILVLSAAMLAFSIVALTRESWRRRVGWIGTSHRLLVIAAVGSALALLLSGLVIPQRLF